MKDLVHSIPIDTIEVLRKRVENAVTTICNNRRMLVYLITSFEFLRINTLILGEILSLFGYIVFI
jgi:hypothetical protein